MSEGITQIEEWRCPACNTNNNSQGLPLVSSWAVACHIAGKIRSLDHTHRKWAEMKVGNIIYDNNIRASISALAEELESTVIEENQSRYRQEQEEMRRLIAERDAREDPSVSAYRLIPTLETNLHNCVRNALIESFGEEETGWWIKAIPYPIRVDCAKRRESDPAREELYSYTDLIDLKTIIEKNFKVFAPHFRNIHMFSVSQGEFLSNLTRSNQIRRRVMHTVRTPVTVDDVKFLQQYCEVINRFIQVE